MVQWSNLKRRDFLKQAGFATTALVLASCGTTGTSGNRPDNEVVIWAPGDSSTDIKDWSKDVILKEVEKATNTKIKIEKISWESYPNKVSASVSSRQLPDIIASFDSPATRTVQQWVRNEVIAPFEGELADAMPHIVDRYKTDQTVLELKVNDKIYAQPVYWDTGWGASTRAAHVRKDLLDAYGMAVPETFDQYFAFLKRAIQDGKKGVVFAGAVGAGEAFVDPLPMFLGAYGVPSQGWVKKGENFEFWAVQPKVKDAFMLFRRMANAGLIDNAVWELDGQKARERYLTGNYASYIGLAGGHTGRIQNAFDLQKKGYQTWILPASDAGTGMRGYTAGPQFYSCTYITNLPGNNPQASARVLNYLNSPEGLKLTALGIKGRDYEESGETITFLPQRAEDNFPSAATSDTGAHPLATPIVSWIPQEWQDFMLLYGKEPEFKEWYDLMWENTTKYLVNGYGTNTSTQKWTDFGPTNLDLMARTFLPMVKAKSDDEASGLFDDFVKKWNEQGGAEASKEMSAAIAEAYKEPNL